MKIIKPGVKPGVIPKEILWWCGHTVRCTLCKCEFRLEPHDTIIKNSIYEKDTEKVKFKCPTCQTLLSFEKGMIKTSSVDTSMFDEIFDEIFGKKGYFEKLFEVLPSNVN
jgi:hypothetical protein